jgi:DNA repair exonuclease SbcCD ATPase subunit
VKHVNFQKIYIQNFLSVGKPGIEINFQEGINLITGVNHDKDSRNGVGKSTIIESLYWCLFGDTMREIKKDQVVNNINKKECAVSLYFTVSTESNTNSYHIIREAKPSKILIHENGVDITKSTLAKADNFIVDLINASGDVFQNAVIMTANNTTPFMAQKKGDKRKFIEDMLRLSVFGDMALLLRNDFAETRKNYEIVFDKNQTIQNNIKIYEEQQEKQNTNKTQRIDDVKKRIEGNDREIKEAEESLILVDEDRYNVLTNSIKNYPTLISSEKTTHKLQTKASHELEFQIKQKKEKLKELNEDSCVCYACKQDLPESHKHKIEQTKLELIEEIKVAEKKYEKIYGLIYTTNAKIIELENNLNRDKDELHSLELIINDNNNKNKKITQLKKWTDQLLEDINNIKNEENNFTDLISSAQLEFSSTKEETNKLQHKLKVIDSARFVVSEEGVKSFIVKKMLQLLNNKLNHYLTKLEAPCKCYFNEYFEEIIINDRNQECSYFNFSGGERKRIDLAILFMFQDIRRLQSDVTINLSMYDELFDSALDERGSECILELLKERVEQNNESIYIVSHNKNTVKAGINNILQLQKLNGITTLVCE